MGVREAIQEAMKEALRSKQQERLDCLRMAKGALLLKEKEAAKGSGISEEDAIATLRKEVKKRQETVEMARQVSREEEAAAAEREVAILEEFLPKQLSEAEVEAKVRACLAEHPEINHAGKLTGLMKKELGDLADGKVLNEVCRRVLEG
jgi:uncharacterized protein YqeY